MYYGKGSFGKMAYANSNDLSFPDGGDYEYGDLDVSVIAPFKPDLIPYLPEYYHSSHLIENVMNTFSNELGRCRYGINDVHKQMYISTATWGLSIWEDILNIKPVADSTYDERRIAILTKLQGQGVTTKALIQKMAETFSGCAVEVIEHSNDCYITIRFIGVVGTLPNLATFIEMLDEIIPAHVGYEFEFSKATWDFVKRRKDKWNGLFVKYTWDNVKDYR